MWCKFEQVDGLDVGTMSTTPQTAALVVPWARRTTALSESLATVTDLQLIGQVKFSMLWYWQQTAWRLHYCMKPPVADLSRYSFLWSLSMYWYVARNGAKVLVGYVGVMNVKTVIVVLKNWYAAWLHFLRLHSKKRETFRVFLANGRLVNIAFGEYKWCTIISSLSLLQ